jgi:hypothetical protein
MRIVTQPGFRSAPPWHLRGSSFDRYEAGRWSHGPGGEASPLRPVWSMVALSENGHALIDTRRSSRGIAARERPGLPGSEEVFAATVTLEDIGAGVLFVASEPLAVRLQPRGPIEDRARVLGGRNREFRVSRPPGPIRYVFMSRARAPSTNALRAAGDPAIPDEVEGLAEPIGGLSRRVGELARELTADAPTRLGKVEAVIAHLQSFEYTLDLSDATSDPDVDPIETFLFDLQAGHCEYFATALVVLLREEAIPARIVNGYYGGEYNGVGEFYAVRQADAHSWVEVHFGELGWVTFDPTPPDGRDAADDTHWWPAGAQLLDALRNAYLQWVIDYDFRKQLELLEGVGLRGGTSRGRLDATSLGLGLGLVGLFGLGAWALRRRRRPPPLATVLLRRLLRRLRRAGHQPRAHESIPSFAARLQTQGVPGAAAVGVFARAYERWRFGPATHGAAADELRALAQRAHDEVRAG